MTRLGGLDDLRISVFAHTALIAALLADYTRRHSDGALTMVWSAIALLGLFVGGLMFALRPRAFFFMRERDSSSLTSQPAWLPPLAWLIVVGCPIGWLLAVLMLSETSLPELGVRIVASYLLFAWIAASIILAPALWSRR